MIQGVVISEKFTMTIGWKRKVLFDF